MLWEAEGRQLFVAIVVNFPCTAAMHPQPQPFQLIRSSLSLSLSLPLLGLEADLFYVHEGAINTYAMHFTVPVPADVHELEFSWQSLIAYPVSYHRLCYRSSLPFISNLICTPLTDYLLLLLLFSACSCATPSASSMPQSRTHWAPPR